MSILEAYIERDRYLGSSEEEESEGEGESDDEYLGSIDYMDLNLLKQQVKEFMNLDQCQAGEDLDDFIRYHHQFLKIGVNRFRIKVWKYQQIDAEKLSKINSDSSMRGSVTIQPSSQITNVYFIQIVSYIIKTFPNLQRLCLIEEKFSQDTLKAENTIDELKPFSLRYLQLKLKNNQNIQFYKQLLEKAAPTLKSLAIQNKDWQSGKDIHPNTVSTLTAIESSSILTELIFTHKETYIGVEDISLLGNFRNLQQLHFDCKFDINALQLILEREFMSNLSNLTSLYLKLQLPDMVKALSGPHKSLMSLTCIQRTQVQTTRKIQQFSLEEAMAIVEGKKYGFKFKAPFYRPRELIKRCPTAITIDISEELKKKLKRIMHPY
ncbi:hypothetical protein FGO68_gene8693 [Halteria grandinella]|uniref:Uncharacterized protein n=1 Tax=Halteria grandinella TaxID=5974 RepID=A0A8J8NXI7_HALGN|nr:hypothetical protein FGO68_gene8693 [Halteria grandinella]